MSWLWFLLRSPSAQRGQPRRYAINQLGHAYVIGGGLVLLGLPLWLVLTAYAAWELAQFAFFGADPADNLDDMAHVALIGWAAAHAAPALIPIHALFLGAGILSRMAEKERAR